MDVWRKVLPKHFVLHAQFCLVLTLLIPAGLGWSADMKPQRIVSLNLCTDQILMMLVSHERIKAITRLSKNPDLSVMATRAQKLPVTNGQAEQVFMLKPDLVLASPFSTRATVSLLRRLGRKVVVVPPAGNFADIFKNIQTIGRAVGERAKADRLIGDLKRGLAEVKAPENSSLPIAALYFAQGYSAGKKTLVNSVVCKSGLQSLGNKLGIRGIWKLSLESLILHKPDVLILGQPQYRGNAKAYEVFSHPAMRYLKARTPHTSMADALTICGTPDTLKAVLKLRKFVLNLTTNSNTTGRQ